MADIMDGKRRPNGSRERVDGHGDPWASEHRGMNGRQGELGKYVYMDDIDALVSDSTERILEDVIFAEYETDKFENRDSPTRRFALVAIFDRKVSEYSALLPQSFLSAGVQRYICQQCGRNQPEGGKPQFFYVIGPPAGPWELVRVNLKTAEWERRWPLASAAWQEVWEKAGIAQTRMVLKRWLAAAV